MEIDLLAPVAIVLISTILGYRFRVVAACGALVLLTLTLFRMGNSPGLAISGPNCPSNANPQNLLAGLGGGVGYGAYLALVAAAVVMVGVFLHFAAMSGPFGGGVDSLNDHPQRPLPVVTKWVGRPVLIIVMAFVGGFGGFLLGVFIATGFSAVPLHLCAAQASSCYDTTKLVWIPSLSLFGFVSGGVGAFLVTHRRRRSRDGMNTPASPVA